MVSFEEILIDFSFTCYDQGFLLVEDAVPFFTLVEMFPFFKNVFILLLSLHDPFVLFSCDQGSDKEGVW